MCQSERVGSIGHGWDYLVTPWTPPDCGRTKQLLLMRPRLGRDMCVCVCYGHRFHFKYPYWFTNYTSFGLLASLDLQINIQPQVGEETGDRGSAGMPISRSVTPSSVETQCKCCGYTIVTSDSSEAREELLKRSPPSPPPAQEISVTRSSGV